MFVKRNPDGKIVAVSAEAEPGFGEQVTANDAELQAFLADIGNNTAGLDNEVQRLRSSDAELIRVVEDLINLLTDKGFIQFTELPEAARQKLLQRKSLRRSIRHLDLLGSPNDDDDDMMP